jgi:hypothetical protein
MRPAAEVWSLVCCYCYRPVRGTVSLAESLLVGAMAQEQKDNLEYH